jgi:hypothetical protein
MHEINKPDNIPDSDWWALLEKDEDEQLSVTGPYKQWGYAMVTAELIQRAKENASTPRPQVVPMHLTQFARKLPSEEQVIDTEQ